MPSTAEKRQQRLSNQRKSLDVGRGTIDEGKSKKTELQRLSKRKQDLAFLKQENLPSNIDTSGERTNYEYD